MQDLIGYESAELKWMNIPNSGADAEGYVVDGLKSGTMYTFWVRAVAGDSRGKVAMTADSMAMMPLR